MKSLDEKTKTKIILILRKHEVIHAAVFGSFARGEATKKNDLDLLVELPEKKSLLDLVDIKLDLDDELGKKIDVLTYTSINPKIKESVMSEMVEIF